MKTSNYFTVLLLMFSFLSCEKNEINFYDVFQDKLVVYGIIDSRNPVQLIKIQCNTPRAVVPNDKKVIKNLEVKIIENNNVTYNLRDTVIEGIENYTAYYSPQFKFRTGSFILMITSDTYPSCWASVNVPEKQKMTVNYGTNAVRISIPFNLTTKGYFYHTYLNYAVTEGSGKMIKTIEIPSELQANISGSTPVYPDKILEEETKIGEILVPYDCINYVKDKIIQENGEINVSLGSCWLVLYSLDWNLYNYYHSVNGFKDPFSIRLDQSYWTNVSGGFGIFGALRSDSVEIVVR